MELEDLELEDEDFRNFLREVNQDGFFFFLYEIYYFFFQVTLPKKTDENKPKTSSDERLAIKPEPGV